MMASKKFYALNGAVITRKGIQRIIDLAKKENETEIIYRLSKVLNEQPNGKKFKIVLEQYPAPGLNAARHSGIYKDALDNCGRLKPGFQFKDGSILKIVKKRRPAVKKAKPTAKKIVAKKPVTKKTISKKTPVRPTKEKLAKVNPEPVATKPKSVSVATAIKDVLSTGKYKVKPMQANVLYTVLKDVEDITAEDIEINPTKFQKAIIQSIPDYMLYFFDYGDDINKPVITLSVRGVEFVNAIRGRLESLRNQKYNYSMFDGLTGRKPAKKVTQTAKGLNAPEVDSPEIARSETTEDIPVVDSTEIIAEPVQEIPVAPIATRILKNPLVQNIGQKSTDGPSQFYTVNGEVGKFLQRVERKPVDSVVITMDGEQGAGKTTTLYKFMDAFAAPGNSCLYISGEEHPKSELAIDKVNKYLSTEAQQNIDTVPEIQDTEQLYELIADYDVIFIDSWQKLLGMVGTIRLDKDLRKRFNGKVFVIIFQQTTTGRTKGGAEIVFDGDIIIKMVKEARFADNYAHFDKNRYTLVPLETIYFNIATGTVYNPEAEPENEAEPVQAVEPRQKTELQFSVV